MNKVATVISYLFHPLLMATYGCLLVFFGLTSSIYAVFTPLNTKVVITLIVFSFTFIMPALNLLILYKLNYISSLKLEKKEERLFPFLMTAICYLGLFYLMYDFNIWPAIKLFILGGGLCILLTAIVTIWWQISAHLMGVGGLVGMLISFAYYLQMPLLTFISGTLIISSLVAFARLQLQAHKPSQVYVGFLSGVFLILILFTLAQQFKLL
jgi:hypothetical protein